MPFLHALRAALANWIRPKSAPVILGGNQWTGTSFVDSYQRHRDPAPNDLLAQLKNTAFTCATINAAVCASFPPRLFVATADAASPLPRCLTRALDRASELRLRSQPHLPPLITRAARIEEVLDHPLLTLLRQVNPVHNAFDLWELTTLYQEIHGSAYWLLDRDALGTPVNIWILPAQNVVPRRKPDSANLIDFFEYRNGAHSACYDPADIIHFRYPDPRNPYSGGLGPLRACWEQAALLSDFAAFKKSKFDNRAIPDAVVSPDAVLGEEERDRLEAQWNSKFRRGGTGRVVVAETGINVHLLNQSMGDLALLADVKATREDIANAFHVPLSFLSTETNLANLQAAEHQHMAKAILPRLRRRDEKINEQLVGLFDPTGRLFVASEDPVPANQDQDLKQTEQDLKFGLVTINEVRGRRGLPPVAWGDTPWLPLAWAPSDLPERAAFGPHASHPDVGRNKPIEIPSEDPTP
jgi:HK97 family phage portal protein